MSKLLGIDYGKRKIGLALADGILAEPHSVLRFKTLKKALEKIDQVIQAEQVEQVVVGISEGKMGEETKRFGINLQDELGIPVVFQDETLTTQEAQELSIIAQIKRKKRRELEDAYSATLILQDYLDSK